MALFATVCLDVGGGSFFEKLLSLAQLILIFFFLQNEVLVVNSRPNCSGFPKFSSAYVARKEGEKIKIVLSRSRIIIIDDLTINQLRYTLPCSIGDSWDQHHSTRLS